MTASIAGIIASVWGIVEPFIALLQFLIWWSFKGRDKISENHFDMLYVQAFEEVKNHLKNFSAQNSIKGNSDSYKSLKTAIKREGDKYLLRAGEIHLRLFEKFHLPSDNRVDRFLIISFFFIHGYEKILNSFLFRERILKFFGFKKTFLHYISIPNWRNKSVKVLIKEIVNIIKTSPNWNDRYLIPKNQDIAKANPYFGRAVDKVLSNGVISEKSIFNLASTEKLVFVHKYGEGFADVFNAQTLALRDAKMEVQKWTKSSAQNAQKKLEHYRKILDDIDNKWLKAPIGYSLEEIGFQKLFNHMDGVYVLPLSMIPDRYHKQTELYVEEVVIEKAQQYIDDAIKAKNPFVSEINRSLKFLILTHVIPVNEISILTQERTLEISSPTLSRMLFTSYLSKDTTGTSNLYINDIVRNVDFKSLLESSKTDILIVQYFEAIKKILWEKFNIDVFKPYMLSLLSVNQQVQLVESILEIDVQFKKPYLTRKIAYIVDFYRSLSAELDEMRRKAS